MSRRGLTIVPTGPMAIARQAPQLTYNTLFTLAALLTALLIAWQALAQVDFLYRAWYPLIGIDATIAEYGPRNVHRKDFQTTSQAERVRLFGAINDAIHRHGEGLEHIVYLDTHGKPIDRLLTAAEITHLRDVARLVDRFTLGGGIALLLWAALLGWSSLRCRALPSTATCFVIITLITLGGGLLAFLIGPVKVFYALHEWVFPAGHQWFFYYEESLMTMLMQAPDLFGCIALVWLLLALAVFALLLKLSAWLHGTRCAGGHCAT